MLSLNPSLSKQIGYETVSTSSSTRRHFFSVKQKKKRAPTHPIQMASYWGLFVFLEPQLSQRRPAIAEGSRAGLAPAHGYVASTPACTTTSKRISWGFDGARPRAPVCGRSPEDPVCAMAACSVYELCGLKK